MLIFGAAYLAHFFAIQLDNRPSSKYPPKIFKEGDIWCALYGKDLESGVVGFGSSPKKALEAFNRRWDKENTEQGEEK